MTERQCRRCRRTRSHHARGLCHPCYLYAQGTGILDEYPTTRYKHLICMDCDRTSDEITITSGLCRACFNWRARHGGPRPGGLILKRRHPGNCPECKAPIPPLQSEQGLCKACRARHRRAGTVFNTEQRLAAVQWRSNR